MEIDSVQIPQSAKEIREMSYDDDDSVMSSSTKDSSNLNSTTYEDDISQDKPKSRRTIQKESMKKLDELRSEDATSRVKTSQFQTEVLSMLDGARKDKKERHDARLAILKARDEKREEREQKREERADRREKREDRFLDIMDQQTRKSRSSRRSRSRSRSRSSWLRLWFL